jgi:hypothetical protein
MSESPVPTATRKAGARAAADFAIGYVLLVAFCALIRGTASLVGGPAWIIESMPWPEVFYGPAIALGAVWAVSRVNPRVEAWLRQRRA